jgi:hypothetical protein
VLGGMSLTTLFFFFYAGVQANYLLIVILAASLLTLTSLITTIAMYVYMIRSKKQVRQEEQLNKDEVHGLTEVELEFLRREIYQQANGLTTNQLMTLRSNKLKSQEMVYHIAFRMALVIGFIFNITRLFTFETFMSSRDDKDV